MFSGTDRLLRVNKPFVSGSVRGDALELLASGQRTVGNAHGIEEQIGRLGRHRTTLRPVAIDVRAIERFDTFGALLLERAWRVQGGATEVYNLSDTYRELMEGGCHSKRASLAVRQGDDAFVAMLARVGHTMVEVGHDLVQIRPMLGELAVVGLCVVARPRRPRATALVYQLERVGFRAVPIVVLIAFVLGCVLAQHGLFNFRSFGADAYVVDLIGILVLCELGVLIVSIMVAGRSASAYTAELGSRRIREEIDALRITGLDPTEILVLPRILALVIAVPLLTFLGFDGRSLWRRAGLVTGASIPTSSCRGVDRPRHLRGRHAQSAIHGAHDRGGCLCGRLPGSRQRRIARVSHHRFRGQIDLSGHRDRWPVRGVLRGGRNVADAGTC